MLFVLGGNGLPRHQRDGAVDIVRFDAPIENFLDRAIAFGDALGRVIDGMDALEIAHFRDPWSGAPIALRPHAYATVYEVNALPSIELPHLFPALGPSTLEKVRALELACCDAADSIVTPSQTTAGCLESLGVDGAKIRVIPNGADVCVGQALLPVLEDRQECLSYILYFGSPQSWQGIDTLFRAFARLADFPDLRLVLCASTESRAWKPYEKLAEKLGIAERLIWRWALDAEELAYWRRGAVASVAPLTDCARNAEQGCAPLKILESMASGVAVVASDLPPVRELIAHGENGWLVHPDRPAELARALRILLDNPALARRLGESARRTVQERFTWETSLASLRSEYRRLLEERVDAQRSAAHR